MKMFKLLSPDDLPLWCYECGERSSYSEVEDNARVNETKVPHLQWKCDECGALYKYYPAPPRKGNGLRFHKK